MSKKSSQHDGLGGSVLVDRRDFVGKMGLAAAGVTAAALVPFRSSLASTGAKAGPLKTTTGVSYAQGGIPDGFLSYSESIPYVCPRLTDERVIDPTEHVFLA
jgi:hypothetical protein